MALVCLSERGEQQNIAPIKFEPSLEMFFKTSFEKYVVDSYSKSEDILNGSLTKFEFTMTAQDSSFDKKIQDFGSYLRQRRKAAILKLGSNSLYILPPSATGQNFLQCIFTNEEEIKVVSASVPSSSKSLSASSSSTLTSSPKEQEKAPLKKTTTVGSHAEVSKVSAGAPTRSSSSSSVAKGGPGSDNQKSGADFLSSLVTKVSRQPH